MWRPNLILYLGPVGRAHLAIAVADHIRRLARDGQDVPAEVLELDQLLWPGRKRNTAPGPVTQPQTAAAARMRRSRARKRGDNVPYLPPGRPRKRNNLAA